jgi:predicted TIM-barrel fold metal-dependent hydrolase
MYLPEIDAPVMRRVIGEWETRYGGRFSGPPEWVEFWCASLAEDGYVGIKFSADIPARDIDDGTANRLYERLRSGDGEDADAVALGVWIMHEAIARAPANHLVVSIHCGLVWETYRDYRSLHPANVVPLLLQNRDTIFDLYHGGIPWVREMAVIGNQYPNANLNLCWAHQISPFLTEHFLNEWIDLVPTNKIIGFGGDTRSPEKTYGVLEMTISDIAGALAERVKRGLMSERRATDIARDWLYENPRRIYRLEQR